MDQPIKPKTSEAPEKLPNKLPILPVEPKPEAVLPPGEEVKEVVASVPTEPKKHPHGDGGEGRPTKRTPEIVKKLEEAFAIDATVEEACFYAGITKPTYYSWIEKDKGLSDRLEELRQKPVLLARQRVVKELGTDWDKAFKYLERKRKNEFAMRTEHTGPGGADLSTMSPEQKEKYDMILAGIEPPEEKKTEEKAPEPIITPEPNAEQSSVQEPA